MPLHDANGRSHLENPVLHCEIMTLAIQGNRDHEDDQAHH